MCCHSELFGIVIYLLQAINLSHVSPCQFTLLLSVSETFRHPLCCLISSDVPVCVADVNRCLTGQVSLSGATGNLLFTPNAFHADHCCIFSVALSVT